MEFLYRLADFWPHALLLTLLLAAVASGHAVLHKRDSRAAALWMGVIWLLPLAGPALYFILGVNRVRRKAMSLRKGGRRRATAPRPSLPLDGGVSALCPEAVHLEMLAQTMGRIVRHSLTPGNAMAVLVNGDAAYPAMLSAIESATQTISLSTYVFDNDRSGRRFVEALGKAVKRGVKARILIDAAGAHYSAPSIIHGLRRAHVEVGRFLPLLAPWRLMAMNLRNHRKILVADGRVGFTGGMNLREGNLVAEDPPHPVQDLHFRLEGPAVAQLQEAFVADWFFVTGEALDGPQWFPALEARGNLVARAIPDGPDEDFEKLRWTILAALSCARQSVKILTPYFLPDNSIISAMNMAALRGVRVDIALPGQNNLPYVHWASRAMWWQVLERGCNIWLTRAPFDHSKLMLVDGAWTLVGSGNWDARSLRLNFEFNLECYGREFAASMESLIESKLQGARRVTLAEVDGRSVAGKLRDGIARLFAPYL